MKKIRLILAVLACLIGSFGNRASATRTVYVIDKAAVTDLVMLVTKSTDISYDKALPVRTTLDKKVIAGGTTHDNAYVVVVPDGDQAECDRLYFRNGSKQITESVDIHDGMLCVVESETENNGWYNYNKLSVYRPGSFTIVEPKLYLRGEISDGEALEQYSISTDDGLVYTGTIASIPSGKFKIASPETSGNWSYAYSTGDMNMVPGREYTCGANGANGYMELASPLTDVTVRFDCTDSGAPGLTFTATQSGEVTPANRIYMDFGSDLRRLGNSMKAPRVKLLSDSPAGAVALTPDDFNAAARMSRAKVNGVKTENSTMWYVDFTDDQLASARGLVFFFEPSAFDSSADNYRSYVADIASGNPAEFIYCADGTDAVRSYLAFGQYEAGCAAPVTKLCLAGEGIGATADTYTVLSSSDGVFSLALSSDGTLDGARFGLSRFTPADYSSGAADSRRARATFNLGLLGCDLGHEAVASGKLPLTVGSSAGEVHCVPCRTMPVGTDTPSEWFVSKSCMGADTRLIVDTQASPMSLTLLTVDLTPSLADVKTFVETKPLSIAEAELFGAASAERLMAEAGSGKVLFTNVNHPFINATINVPAPEAGSVTGSDGSEQGYEFKPLYQISDGSEIIGSSEGASGDVLAIGGFDPEGTATLGIRTLYTDNYAEAGKTPTGLTFRTPVSRTTVGGTFEFPQPVAEIVNRCFSPGSVNTLDDPDLNARTYTLGAYAEVKVTAPEAEGMIWYADFRLAAEGDSYHVSHPERANGGEVVHKAHTAATAVPGAMSIDYNPWAEGDTYSEANNWSAKLAASEVWPLNLPDVVEVKREYKYGNDWQFDEAEPKASVSGSVRAVYPVVVETVPSVMTVGPSPAAAPVRRAPRADEPFYKLLLKSGEPVNVTLSLNGGDLTAVRDIVAPETAGAEVEYYNLHGVRMSGALAPGVYIRRCGSAARKVVVR